MRRTNSGKSVGSRPKIGQDSMLAVRVSAASSGELEQQLSLDQQPLLQQHPQGFATGQPWQITALSVINDSTKWTVSATVFAVLLWQHNEYAAWCVVGAVFSAFLCKVLKHVIRQERPDQAQKSDPGMPSSHANSLNFLSVYAALSLNYHTRSHPTAVALAVCSVTLGVFLTWLRVRLGYHTWPQVLVGAALGASTATGWFFFGTAAALPALQRTPAGLPLLYGTCLVAMAAFAVKNVLSWAKERKERQQKQQQQLQWQQQQLELLHSKLQAGNDSTAQQQQQQQQQQESAAQPAVVSAGLAY
ncbi:hypothetical protein OEZ85_011837 [Tetradesmus obliquus]|uniref:Phosphatidic acid phosphatase type 2/haloperoxidase domain-containing protein n=1 Tax=Tetradesmus obliquus TaxID=3088 RepID=A0ABY8TRV8_TETOB|nr:hypothetical protein OEZ85_011837 [Tetradesmus obliquus]